MTSPDITLRAFTDAAADAVARAIAGMQAEMARERAAIQRERDTLLAEARAVAADMRAAAADLARHVSERMVTVKDGVSVTLDDIRPLIDEAFARYPAPQDGAPGRDADPAEVRRLVDEAVSRLPPPKDGTPGRDVDMAEVQRLVEEAVSRLPPPQDGAPGRDADPTEVQRLVDEAVSRLPPPQDGAPGRDVDMAEVQRLVDEAVSRIPIPRDGEPGKDGLLPIARVWEDRVHYAGEVAVHGGSLYQATRDTGREPPHVDWICIAARGQDGADGISLDICGTYDPEESYRRLSIVAFGGSSFIARRDLPGPCPGPDWQLVASQGKRGHPGPRGESLAGPPGPGVVALDIAADGLITLTNGDGSTVTCDLYPLLEKL